MFENIFNEEIDKEPRDRFGRTPFQIACEKGHARIAEFVIKSSIENNIDLNWRYDGRTGFHAACLSGRVKMVELLIKNSVKFNIDLNAKDTHGKTGYHYSCSSGYGKVQKLICAR